MRYLYYEDKYFNGLLNLWNEEAEIRGFINLLRRKFRLM